LEALEPAFQQDLNNDGTIGAPATVIEANGSTSLVQSGNNYFLYPVGGSSGPALSISGAPIMTGQFDPWTPIAAEQAAGGYEIAWKATDADQFTVWQTDSNGNYLWSDLGVVSGSSPALESLEPSFQQDLNKDGTIGAPATLALLTNYLAATFVPPAGQDAGSVVVTQPPDQQFLAKPSV
jgi:serralysin